MYSRLAVVDPEGLSVQTPRFHWWNFSYLICISEIACNTHLSGNKMLTAFNCMTFQIKAIFMYHKNVKILIFLSPHGEFYQAQNASKPFSAERTPLGELTMLPRLFSRLRRGYPFSTPLPFDAFGVSISAHVAPRFILIWTSRFVNPGCATV